MRRCIIVGLKEQRLWAVDAGRLDLTHRISSAFKGVGEQSGSGCTPRGWHSVRARIGAGVAENTVFVGRRPTGEIYGPELATAQPERDWILSRILWLSGIERGRNRGGDLDTQRRFIYIHGSPDTVPMGVPFSHGCIRMHNAGVIELFDWTHAGESVLVSDDLVREAPDWALDALKPRMEPT